MALCKEEKAKIEGSILNDDHTLNLEKMKKILDLWKYKLRF